MAVYTAVYVYGRCTRPCTWNVHGSVHGCVRVYTAVYTARVDGRVCTQPVYTLHSGIDDCAHGPGNKQLSNRLIVTGKRNNRDILIYLTDIQNRSGI